MRQRLQYQRRRPHHLQHVALRIQQQTQRLQNMRLVIRDQQSAWLSLGLSRIVPSPLRNQFPFHPSLRQLWLYVRSDSRLR